MIEVNGCLITGHMINYAFWLLSILIGADNVNDIKNAVQSRKSYNTVFTKKRGHNAKRRRLDIPPKVLVDVQKLVLNNFLNSIDLSAFPGGKMLTGYIRGKSVVNNIVPHISGTSFIQIDLSDAFPSVTTEMVRQSLSVIFELRTIRRIFRSDNFLWFRRKFLAQLNKTSIEPQDSEDDDIPTLENTPIDTMWAIREILIWLTVFDNSLPQGAPTSPFLFNLVLLQYKLPVIIEEAVKLSFKSDILEGEIKITLYADNITISSEKRELSMDVANNVIEAIEGKTPFRINSKKTHCTTIKHGSPRITGLSIGTKKKTFVTAPQRIQRRTRGLLHTAITHTRLRPEALGMVAYLMQIYGGKKHLPNQIRKPYEILLSVINS